MSALMIQGCTSDAGKSTIVAGLCRILLRRQISVAPFKPQNMALNSAVTLEGGEIGRAQAVQAMAAGIPAQNHMNPILLKPNSDIGAQVIIQGKVYANMNAVEYHQFKADAMSYVLDSFHTLNQQYSHIIIEGAGSPAEINLRENDIANMGFAEAIDCPVILVADIDRGGVFAHLVGTVELLSETEKKRIKGFIINRFRGDIHLLTSGIRWLENRTHIPVLGVLPYLHHLTIAAEDAIISEQKQQDDKLTIIVPVLPRISNHTDFDALRHHPQVNFQYIRLGEIPPPADLIILPGSKSIRDDLAALKQHGWEDIIAKHCRYGGKLLGICGGFQMLGKSIHDPQGLEGVPGSSTGLHYLDMETTLHSGKILKNVNATLLAGKIAVQGYEIHCGISSGEALSRPVFAIDNRYEGAISSDNAIMGTYLHGLFDKPDALHALLEWAGFNSDEKYDYLQDQEDQINRLADAMEQAIDIPSLLNTFNLQ